MPRHRSGVVHGAVGPSVSQARAMSAATGDADVSEEDSDDPDVRLARESAAVSDDALVSLPAIAMKQTRARIGAISPAVGAMSTSRSVASNTSKASKKTSATLARSSSHATLTTPSGKHEGSRKPSSAKAARSALGSSAKQQSVSESAVSPMSRSPSRRSTARRTGRTAFVEPVDAGPVHPGSLVRYQHTLVVRHEEASALVRQYIETAFEDQPVNRCEYVACGYMYVFLRDLDF